MLHITVREFLEFVEDPEDMYVYITCPDDPGISFEGTVQEFLDGADEYIEYIANLDFSSFTVNGEGIEVVALR